MVGRWRPWRVLDAGEQREKTTTRRDLRAKVVDRRGGKRRLVHQGKRPGRLIGGAELTRRGVNDIIET